MKKFFTAVLVSLVLMAAVNVQAQQVYVPRAPSAGQLQGMLPQQGTSGGHYVQSTTMEQQVQYLLAPNGTYYQNVVWVPVTRSVWVPDPVVVYAQPQVVYEQPSVGQFVFAAAIGAVADHLIFGRGRHGGGHRR